jgi:sigma-B regulation protein RsbU (phosphoserine phosphatase)
LSDAFATNVHEDLEDLYETAPCGYLSVTADGVIAKCNQTLLTWTGRSRDELIGARFSTLLSIGSRIYNETHLAPLLRMQGHVSEVALDILSHGGIKLPMLANAAEKRSDDGKLLFTRFTLLEASDRRRYEHDLIAARDNAVERARSGKALEAAISTELEDERATATLRDQFIAVLGHDLRNPLAAIESGLHLLRKEELGSRGERVVELMEGSIRRAARLIDDVMDLARIRLGGGIGIHRSRRASIGPTLRQVVNEMQAISPTSAITLDAPPALEIECDPARIGQLLSNLLGNAITHGAPGYPIRVSAGIDAGEFVLTVTNSGDPIPEQTMRHLFQPFFRGAARPSQQGLGLGLHIASEIAKAHGGVITASSAESATTFRFAMPL